MPPSPSQPKATPAPTGTRAVAAVRALGRLARLVERTCKESGLSLPQYRVLAFIAEERHLQRASELAGRASISRPTLTALVDGLERQGLLERRAVAGDRRGTAVEITAKGRDAIAAADLLLVERVEELVPPHAADGLIRGLVAIGESLDERMAAQLESSPPGKPR